MGLGEGTTFPALSAMLAAWIPSTERSKLGSLVFGGGQVSYLYNIQLVYNAIVINLSVISSLF